MRKHRKTRLEMFRIHQSTNSYLQRVFPGCFQGTCSGCRRRPAIFERMLATLCKFGQARADTDQTCASLGLNEPNMELGPNLARLGPHVADMRIAWSNFGPHRPNSEYTWSDYGER